MPAPLKTEAIVLRSIRYGEADRILHLYTPHLGRLSAIAKGARRSRSRFGARLEPFTHVDLLLYTGRSLDVITQAETVRAYGEPLAVDYPRYTSGTAMLETAERFTPMEKEPIIRQFLLLVGGLRALGERVHDPRLVLDAYLLRTLAVAGYAPALDECAVCGTPDPATSPDTPEITGSRSFSVPAGGLTCRSCRPPGAASPSVATVALMRALLRGEWDQADPSQARHQVECSSLVAAYVQWHLEHSIRSLRHVEHV